MKPSIPVLILLCLASHAVPATEAAKIELHVIQTTTLTDEQFLTGAGNGTPLSIAGELRLPRAALELLAKHPRIDARRIGIIGGSRGGVVALYASLKRFQRMYAPPAQFAVYVALYPPCYVTYL
jgi:hypothetical protein